MLINKIADYISLFHATIKLHETQLIYYISPTIIENMKLKGGNIGFLTIIDSFKVTVSCMKNTILSSLHSNSYKNR